jgi:hypothetical protein
LLKEQFVIYSSGSDFIIPAQKQMQLTGVNNIQISIGEFALSMVMRWVVLCAECMRQIKK